MILHRSLGLFFGIATSLHLLGCAPSGDSGATSTADALSAAESDSEVVHVVALKFKDDAATRAQIPAVVRAFQALEQSSVDPTTGRTLIRSLRWGENDSKEGQQKGMELCFVLTFQNAADRDYYVDTEVHHQAFKQLVGPLLDDQNDAWRTTTPKVGNAGVFVYDFATTSSKVADRSVFHVVSFRFKEGTTDAQKADVATAFRALRESSRLPGNGDRLITSFRDGANDSTEGQDKSEDMTFVLTFRDEVERDYYVDQEPNHQQFKHLVGPLLAGAPDPSLPLPASAGAPGVFVIDFSD